MFRTPGRTPSAAAAAWLVAALTTACNPTRSEGLEPVATAASAAAPSPPTASAKPTKAALRGAVSGTIRIKGDPAPTIEAMAPKIPVGKCFLAHDMYTKLFREGEGRTLADVLVAVTEYQGEVEAPPERVRVEAKDCAYDRRTIAMTVGQTLSVQNVGTGTHTPQLLGFPSPALILAIPKGDPVEFEPTKLGQYQLLDRTHSFAFADVFVLNYSSVAVTGLDGKFEISGLPPGKAKVSALLPITGQTLSREVLIPSGGTVPSDFEFDFDTERDGVKARLPESE
jgi:hypothetical protein